MPQFPVQQFLQASGQRAQRQAASPVAQGLGQGMSQGIVGGIQQKQQQGAELRKMRADGFNKLLSTYAFTDETGQPLDASRLLDASQQYIVSGQLPQGIKAARVNPQSQLVPYFQRDPITGAIGQEPSAMLPKGAKVGDRPLTAGEQAAKKRTQVIASKKADIEIKRKAFTQDLNDFLAVDEQIPRGENFIGRMKTGAETAVARLDQSEGIGAAAASHEAIGKRLRVQLVRAAGDVGNINIVEQEAAEQMIPRITDSQAVVKIKRAFLRQVGQALETRNPDKIRQIFRRANVNFTPIEEPQSRQNADPLGLGI